MKIIIVTVENRKLFYLGIYFSLSSLYFLFILSQFNVFKNEFLDWMHCAH